MHIADVGSVKPSVARDDLGVVKAAAILQADHYGWFERVSRGVYGLTPKGLAELPQWADALRQE